MCNYTSTHPIHVHSSTLNQTLGQLYLPLLYEQVSVKVSNNVNIFLYMLTSTQLTLLPACVLTMLAGKRFVFCVYSQVALHTGSANTCVSTDPTL